MPDRRQQRRAELAGVGAAAGLGGLGGELPVAEREQGLSGDRVEQTALGGGQGPAVADEVDVGLDRDVDVGLFGPGTVRGAGAGGHDPPVVLSLQDRDGRQAERLADPFEQAGERVAAVEHRPGERREQGGLGTGFGGLLGPSRGPVDDQRDEDGDQHHRPPGR